MDADCTGTGFYANFSTWVLCTICMSHSTHTCDLSLGSWFIMDDFIPSIMALSQKKTFIALFRPVDRLFHGRGGKVSSTQCHMGLISPSVELQSWCQALQHVPVQLNTLKEHCNAKFYPPFSLEFPEYSGHTGVAFSLFSSSDSHLIVLLIYVVQHFQYF